MPYACVSAPAIPVSNSQEYSYVKKSGDRLVRTESVDKRVTYGTMGTMSHVLSRRISPGETYASPPNSHNDTVMFVVLVPGSGPDPRIRVVRALLIAGADIYGSVPYFGTALRIVCQTPSPPLKRLVRKFLAHRMRATARHWWLPWPLACRVAGFLV